MPGQFLLSARARIGEPGRSSSDGRVYALRGNAAASLSAEDTFFPAIGSGANFGAALAIGEIGNYPGQDLGSYPAADILIGLPQVNEVQLRYGDDGNISQHTRDFPWPW